MVAEIINNKGIENILWNFIKLRIMLMKFNQKHNVMKNVLKIFGILVLTGIILSFVESGTVTGKVTDEKGNSLAGVLVNNKTTGAKVYTASDGSYKIQVSSGADLLRFSLSGYIATEIKAGNRSIINIRLVSELMVIEDDLNSSKTFRTAKADARFAAEYAAAPSIAGYNLQGGGRINRYNYNFNTEGYSPVNENGFKNVRHNPLSTFSIDVDNASYSNIRRFINMGQLPPADAVRIEEMINYFRYSYPEPSGRHPFAVYTEVAVCPWNNRHLLFQVGLKGKSIDKSTLPPSNLVFLIDVSGSMDDPNKLPLLKSAFGLLVNELRPQDRVAIVVYAGAAGLVLGSTTGDQKDKIMRAIDNLRAGGSTAGGEGLRLAYSVAEKNFIDGGNNRVILATDGDFNVGESSNGGMERLVEEKRKSGVYITVLGFGMGNYKDDKMEIIADKGNGNYAYIDNLQEARRVLVREFGGTLFTIANDVKFQIEFNPARVSSYRLIGYENRLLNDEDFNNDTKDAGEMGSGHNVTALYEIIPAGADERVPSIDPLKYQKVSSAPESGQSNELLTVKVRYKVPGNETSILMEKPVSGNGKKIEEASENIRFAAAVAEFGMLLRDSEFKGNSDFEKVIVLAGSARGEDEEGYRAEFIRMVKSAKGMKSSGLPE